tara:strand:- start:2036 stop:2263 length:228 start_codon:yes stop_codon:yes gene_type:complete
MSKELSFEELQKWDCAEEEFGGVFYEGNGVFRTHSRSNNICKNENQDNYVKEKNNNEKNNNEKKTNENNKKKQKK